MAISELMRSVLFDPQELYDELLYLDFTDIRQRRLMNVLYTLKECCLNVVVSQMHDVWGRTVPYGIGAQHNSKIYMVNLKLYVHLVKELGISKADWPQLLALDDLMFRVTLIGLPEELQSQYYRAELALRRTCK